MYYPEYAEIDGKEYKIDTDFRTALQCFEIIDNLEVDEYERAAAIIFLLFGFIPENDDLFQKMLEKVSIYLQCGKSLEQQKERKKDMDFKQDRGYIFSSFMSDYHIDLDNINLHFWRFIELLEGLSEGSVLNRVRELRNYNLNEEKDEKRKAKIREAQESVALKKSERVKDFNVEEINNMNKFEELIGERKE